MKSFEGQHEHLFWVTVFTVCKRVCVLQGWVRMQSFRFILFPLNMFFIYFSVKLTQTLLIILVFSIARVCVCCQHFPSPICMCHLTGHACGGSCGTIMCTIASVRKKGHNERSKSSLVKPNEPNFTALWDIIRFVSAICSLDSYRMICSIVFKVSHWWFIL